MGDVGLGDGRVMANRSAAFDFFFKAQPHNGFINFFHRLGRNHFDQIVEPREVRNLLAVKTRELAIDRVDVDLVGQLAIRQSTQLHHEGAAQDLLAGGLGGTTRCGLGAVAQIGVDPIQDLGDFIEQFVDGRQLRHQGIFGIDRPDKVFVLEVEQFAFGCFFFAHFGHKPNMSSLCFS